MSDIRFNGRVSLFCNILLRNKYYNSAKNPCSAKDCRGFRYFNENEGDLFTDQIIKAIYILRQKEAKAHT